MTAVITLTAEQVASVLAQQAGAPAPQPQPTPTPPPIITPPPSIPAGAQVYELDWANPQRLIVASFPGGSITAVGFTTGGTPTAGSLCAIAAGDWPSGTERSRRYCLSLLPGDFDHAISWGPLSAGQAVFQAPMGQIRVPFALANADSYYPSLKLRTHYYLNILNLSEDNAGVFVDLQRWNLV